MSDTGPDKERLELLSENAALRLEAAALRVTVETLTKEVAALKEQLTEAVRATKRQAAPFRRKKRKRNPKKPGRKPGHEGSRRPTPPESHRTRHAPALEGCPDCGSDLTDCREAHNFETDIPVVRPIVTRNVFATGWCAPCGKRVASRHPEQSSTAVGAAGSHVGPRAKALAVELKHRFGLPFRKISEFFEAHFGLRVSPGGLAAANHRLAARAEPTFRAMLSSLASEPVVYADETGWRVRSESAWLWVLCSERITAYAITGHRRANVVLELLGTEFDGLLMRDGWQSYDTQLGEHYAMLRCLLHLKHNAEDLAAVQSGEAAECAKEFLEWLEYVFRLRRRANELSPEGYAARAASAVEWFDSLTTQSEADERNQRFIARLRQIRHQVLPCVEDPRLPAANTLAERQVRPAVIFRKISAGNRSERGASTFATLASLTATARQLGIGSSDFIRKLLLQPDDTPLRFWQPALDTC